MLLLVVTFVIDCFYLAFSLHISSAWCFRNPANAAWPTGSFAGMCAPVFTHSLLCHLNLKGAHLLKTCVVKQVEEI